MRWLSCFGKVYTEAKTERREHTVAAKSTSHRTFAVDAFSDVYAPTMPGHQATFYGLKCKVQQIKKSQLTVIFPFVCCALHTM